MDNTSLLRAQAVSMVIFMVAYVVSLGRSRRDEDPNPLELIPRSQADVQRHHNLNLIYNSTDSECIAMIRMGKAPFFCSIYSI